MAAGIIPAGAANQRDRNHEGLMRGEAQAVEFEAAEILNIRRGKLRFLSDRRCRYHAVDECPPPAPCEMEQTGSGLRILGKERERLSDDPLDQLHMMGIKGTAKELCPDDRTDPDDFSRAQPSPQPAIFRRPRDQRANQEATCTSPRNVLLG